jgi:hypothetical protein
MNFEIYMFIMYEKKKEHLCLEYTVCVKWMHAKEGQAARFSNQKSISALHNNLCYVFITYD